MSLFRLISLGSGGMRLINLTKVSVVEMDKEKKTITYIMDNLKSFGGSSIQYSALYQTQEETQKNFDEITHDLFFKQEK